MDTEARAERTLPAVHEIDARLHTDRLAVPGARRDRLAGAEVRRTYTAALADLPDGAMADIDGVPHLVFGGRLLRWTLGGYTGDPATASALVTVITPRSTVAVLAAGYRPVLHESAGQGSATLRDRHNSDLAMRYAISGISHSARGKGSPLIGSRFHLRLHT